MRRTFSPVAESYSAAQARALLADTRKAAGAMKAAWLHVALNLREIRAHELFRRHDPAYERFEDYVDAELKLNRHVVRRMLEAVEYTEEKRPRLLDEWRRDPEHTEVPGYEVLNQLRRVEARFEDQPDEFKTFERDVFDEGVGRVLLKRRLQEHFGDEEPAAPAAPERSFDSAAQVLEDLKGIERRLARLRELPDDVKEKAYELVALLQQYV